jgi:hypothetical protein
MGHTSRAITLGIIAVVCIGCVQSQDGGRRPERNGTVEKMVAAAQRKYDRDQAEVFTRLGDEMESGKVYTKEEAWKEIKDTLAGQYKDDFKQMNSMLDAIAAKERGKFGKRQARIFQAIGRGFESLNRDAEPNHDDRRDDE